MDLSVPIPNSHATWGLVLLTGLLILFSVGTIRLLRQRAAARKMTIEIVDDADTQADVEIRPKDADLFKTVLGGMRTSDKRDAILIVLDNGKKKKAQLRIRANQSSKIESKRLRMAKSFADKMGLTISSGTETKIWMYPVSLWQATFGNADPNISAQWISGTTLGVMLMLIQILLSWIFTG